MNTTKGSTGFNAAAAAAQIAPLPTLAVDASAGQPAAPTLNSTSAVAAPKPPRAKRKSAKITTSVVDQTPLLAQPSVSAPAAATAPVVAGPGNAGTVVLVNQPVATPTTQPSRPTPRRTPRARRPAAPPIIDQTFTTLALPVVVPPSKWTTFWTWLKKWAKLIGLIALIIALLLGWWWWQHRDQTPKQSSSAPTTNMAAGNSAEAALALAYDRLALAREWDRTHTLQQELEAKQIALAHERATNAIQAIQAPPVCVPAPTNASPASVQNPSASNSNAVLTQVIPVPVVTGLGNCNVVSNSVVAQHELVYA